jgi:hypothetical protein
MVTVECAPRVHHNARNLVHLEHIAAAELDAAIKCEEVEKIALETECNLPIRRRHCKTCKRPSESTNKAGYENRLKMTEHDLHNLGKKPTRLYQNPSID